MKEKLMKGTTVLTATVSSFLLPVVVFAAEEGSIKPKGAFSPVADFSISSFVGTLVSLIFLIAGVLAFLYLIWGGVQWITSGGDKGGTQAARDKITAAIIGLAIVLLSWAIMSLLGQFFFGSSDFFFNFKVPSIGGQ